MHTFEAPEWEAARPADRTSTGSAPVSRSRACRPGSAACTPCPDRQAPRRTSRPHSAELRPPHTRCCGGGQFVEQGRVGLVGAGHDSSPVSMRGPTTPRASMTHADSDSTGAMCVCPHPLRGPPAVETRHANGVSLSAPHLGQTCRSRPFRACNRWRAAGRAGRPRRDRSPPRGAPVRRRRPQRHGHAGSPRPRCQPHWLWHSGSCRPRAPP